MPQYRLRSEHITAWVIAPSPLHAVFRKGLQECKRVEEPGQRTGDGYNMRQWNDRGHPSFLCRISSLTRDACSFSPASPPHTVLARNLGRIAGIPEDELEERGIEIYQRACQP